MKRSVALVLTVIIFAAITVCFLRPEFYNPDFGYADRFYGRRIPIELEGDVEFFEEASLGTILPEYSGMSLTLRPKEPYYLYLGTPVVNEYGVWYGEDIGYIERRVGGKWECVCETGPDGATSTKDLTMPFSAMGVSLSWDDRGRYPGGFRIYAPIFGTPGEYRFTINFHVILDKFEVEEEQHSVSFRYTVPRVTSKPFDVISVRGAILSDRSGGKIKSVQVNLRPNHGTPAPFILRDVGSFQPPATEWQECGVALYGMALPDDFEDGSVVTLNFAEHSDGSGEQYTLKLRLWLHE